MPVPFERVHREKIDAVRSVQIGFRAMGTANNSSDIPQAPVEWTSRHAGLDYLSMPEEALILTGDEVPVELTATVCYRISDLKRYLYASTQPDEIVRAAAEGAIRAVAAEASLDGILADERREIEQECLRVLNGRIRNYELGIDVTALHLLDIHPPLAVVPAYRDVADAMEEQQQSINQAEAYYSSGGISPTTCGARW
jgi:regulator of protease activity HflC (stomatin/prohibitin superfamily)